jgi:hypothetical protein
MWRFPGLGASPALAMKMLRQAQAQIVQKKWLTLPCRFEKLRPHTEHTKHTT